jgi:hypothetical protein
MSAHALIGMQTKAASFETVPQPQPFERVVGGGHAPLNSTWLDSWSCNRRQPTTSSCSFQQPLALLMGFKFYAVIHARRARSEEQCVEVQGAYRLTHYVLQQMHSAWWNEQANHARCFLISELDGGTSKPPMQGVF